MVSNFRPFWDGSKSGSIELIDICRWVGNMGHKNLSALTNFSTGISIIDISGSPSMKLSLDEYIDFEGCMAEFIQFKFDEGESFFYNRDEVVKEFIGDSKIKPENIEEVEQLSLF